MTDSPSIFLTVGPGEIQRQLWSPEAQARAAELGFQVRLNSRTEKLTPEQWASVLEGVDALITTWGAPRLDEVVLARNTTLRIVGHAAGSVSPIVSPELYRRGIKVVTANWEMAHSVAEWSLMMTFVAARRLPAYTKFGNYNGLQPQNRLLARAVSDCVIGIWGYGDVAKHFLDMLAPFTGKEILVADDYLTSNEAAARGVRKVDFAELVSTCDILHCLTGLTNENKGRLNGALLSTLREGATVINGGRAALIEPEGFLSELSTGRISAILDVHYHEPPAADDPFLALPNVIMTPHCAGGTTRGRYVPFILEEFHRFFSGQELKYEISEERAMRMTDPRLVKG